MMRRLTRRVWVLSIAIAAAFTGHVAVAQEWPRNTIKIVVSAAAGGPIDVFARVIADRLGQTLGQTAVVENTPGAGGAVGGQRVARATPDGYTVLLGTSATHTFSQLLYAKPLYDAKADFAPVGLMAVIPLVLIVRKDLPANTMAEFVAYAKANAANMNYGSAGVGSSTHLGCALLTKTIGAAINHVPYRGTGPAMQDLMAGRIDFLCEIVVTAAPQVQSGNVRAIATMAQDRSPVLPDVPTTVEGGFPALKADSFTALFVPKGTPPAIVTKLNAAMSSTLDDAGVRGKLEQLGASIVKPEARSPAMLETFVGDELVKWKRIVEASGIEPQ
jgi:tripartite-type tricarboxylate transporter receptor subunit TctC